MKKETFCGARSDVIHRPHRSCVANKGPTTTTTILYFDLNASTLVDTDTVRPGGGEKTLRSSRLPAPNHLLWNTRNEHAH